MDQASSTKVINISSNPFHRGHPGKNVNDPSQKIMYHGQEYTILTGPRGGRFIIVDGKRIYL
jgi:hypothetical protein